MKRILGWREWVALPSLGIDAIKAKADTGARTSALHAYDIRIEDGDVLFKVHPVQRDEETVVHCRAPLIEQRHVRSSTGRQGLRPVIGAELELMGERWPIELTLALRDVMGFRMLLGRQALRRRFLVDPEASFLAPTLTTRRG
jgi:hypothetical protein